MSVTDTDARSVGIVGPPVSTEPVRKALAAAGFRFAWADGPAELVLWVVDVEAGVPEGTRDRFRKTFETAVPRLVVFLAGGDRVPADRSFLPELVELDVRGLLDELGVDGEAVPVLHGSISELAAALMGPAQREERPLTRGGSDHSIFQSVDRPPERRETPEAWIVPVFYGTDRERTGKPSPQDFFGPGRGELSFGVVEVSLPKEREKGEMPTPSWWKPWQRKEDPSRFVLLLKVTPVEKGSFVAELRQAVTGARVPEALVFVHGFKVPFAEAAERAAQVALDLEFTGVPLVYSWPSEGKVFDYTVDEANVEWSAPHFEEFLRMVLAESGARTVHVIAHSMGNRALVRALSSLQAQAAASGGAALRQIIFAAPDVDRDTFVELAAKFQGRAERFTLYGSSNDRALKASKFFHRYPRAGESGENMALAEGIDTIDSSAADTSLIAHSSYGSKRSILADISLLLRYGHAPDGRFGFLPRERKNRKYWVYQP
ncbi:MAG TPA: alpha/beta hydrolase [Thermoanaerobaculia bacterium]|jgi:esterase/lipase superfamily enzyme|nr:alpha/beta hydrolase [Thermoanaerobaculia bacterium]